MWSRSVSRHIMLAPVICVRELFPSHKESPRVTGSDFCHQLPTLNGVTKRTRTLVCDSYTKEPDTAPEGGNDTFKEEYFPPSRYLGLLLILPCLPLKKWDGLAPPPPGKWSCYSSLSPPPPGSATVTVGCLKDVWSDPYMGDIRGNPAVWTRGLTLTWAIFGETPLYVHEHIFSVVRDVDVLKWCVMIRWSFHLMLSWEVVMVSL